MKFVNAVKGKMFKCDSCNETFNGELIELKKSPTNISMENHMMTFKFVDINGIIKGGYKGPDGSIGDQVVCCPLCHQPHLTGFDFA
jgi:hypothetical protein